MFNEARAMAELASYRKVVPTIAYLNTLVGGLSKPSKMPWYSYSIPAEHCKVGSKLRQVKGSVCASCYARKGRYRFPNVADAMEKRYRIMLSDMDCWAGRMAALLERKARGQAQYFRWHDSGDLIDQDHLDALLWIAKQLPHIEFWLPTKEYGLVNRNVSAILAVPNLVVRVSAPSVGTALPPGLLPTSSVGMGPGETFMCPAIRYNEGKCGDCRACWKPVYRNVDYPLH